MLDMQPRLLDRATEILGGEDALSERLGVPEAQVALWRSRQARLPDEVFLRIVDIVLRDDVERAADDRRKEPRRHATP